LSNLQRLSDLTATQLNSSSFFQTSQNVLSQQPNNLTLSPEQSTVRGQGHSPSFSVSTEETLASNLDLTSSDNTSFLKESFT